MRGGAIPILVWGTLLLVLAVGNWIWNDRTVSGLAATGAVVIIYSFGVAVWMLRREAIRRGPPEPRDEVEDVPQTSLAAVLIGLSAGCALFGLAWARFLVDFGIGLFVVALGRLWIEVRSERATARQVLDRQALDETDRR